MKIKNFKINQKLASKLSACVLVGTLTATTLTGCFSSRHNVLKGTILENACVVTFDDGSKDIAVAVDVCEESDYHHYYSILSGSYFASDTCTKEKIKHKVAYHYEIIQEESITNYLTSNELSKEEVDVNDIIAIVNRAVAPNPEEKNTKTK